MAGDDGIHWRAIREAARMVKAVSARSLHGGYLRECWLFEYDSTRRLSPHYGGPEANVQGHKLAIGEGAVGVRDS